MGERKMLDEKQIAFIIAVNNEIYFEECAYYIRQLLVPEGYAIDIVAIREAPSMCAAYNAGMQSSDAKYKVYLHQDVFIRERNFIVYLLERFQKDETVGMMGMMGGIGMPKTGVAYLAWNAGCVDCAEPDMAYRLLCAPEQREDLVVDAVDGLLIATQYDLPWREELFREFDFYDVSASFEMRKGGYKIVVPFQKQPWVMHDSGFAKLDNYDKNRCICLREYPAYFTEEDGFPFCYQEEWEQLGNALAAQVRNLMDQGDWAKAGSILDSYRGNSMKNSALEMYSVMWDIFSGEQKSGVKKQFFSIEDGYEEAYRKYMVVRFLLRRLETGVPETEYSKLKESVVNGDISGEALSHMILHGTLEKEVVLTELENWYEAAGLKTQLEYMRRVHRHLKGKGIPIAYSKRAKRQM